MVGRRATKQKAKKTQRVAGRARKQRAAWTEEPTAEQVKRLIAGKDRLLAAASSVPEREISDKTNAYCFTLPERRTEYEFGNLRALANALGLCLRLRNMVDESQDRSVLAKWRRNGSHDDRDGLVLAPLWVLESAIRLAIHDAETRRVGKDGQFARWRRREGRHAIDVERWYAVKYCRKHKSKWIDVYDDASELLAKTPRSAFAKGNGDAVKKSYQRVQRNKWATTLYGYCPP